MIIFEKFTDDHKGVHFKNGGDDIITVNCKVIEAYSNLCIWSTKMITQPGYSYWFNHYVLDTKERSFELCDDKTGEILIKVSLIENDKTSLKDLDVFGKLKDFKYSLKKIDDNAAFSLYEIFTNKFYDYKDCVVNSGDLVVDIGANIGIFSYYALCKGAKKVYCFEPGEDTFMAIVDNFGNFDNLIMENYAVTSINGFVNFNYNKDSTIGSSVSNINTDNTISVKSINIFDYIKNNNIDNIDYLKIDCEGSEWITGEPSYWQTENIMKNYVIDDKGIWPAIEEFLLDNPNWIIDLKLENCNGLTVLKKVI